MALINCPECTGTVSSKAASCPYCGWIVTCDQPAQVFSGGLPPEKHQNDLIAKQECVSEATSHTKTNALNSNSDSDVKKAPADPRASGGGLVYALGLVLAFFVVKKFVPGSNPDPLRPWHNTDQNSILSVPHDSNRQAEMEEHLRKYSEELKEKARQARQAIESSN